MTVPPPPPGEADDEEQETVLREFIVPPSDLFGDDAAATPEPAGTPAKQSPEDLEATRLRPARVVRGAPSASKPSSPAPVAREGRAAIRRSPSKAAGVRGGSPKAWIGRRLAPGKPLMYGVGGALAVIAVVLAFALADRGGGSANVAGAGSRVTEGSSALPRPTYDPSAAPTWNPKPMAGVALPALRTAQYPGEPASYVMEDRIWDYVGPGWMLATYHYNLRGVARDREAFQGIYLISPEGYPFFLWKLRTDFTLGVVYWVPDERVAWIARCPDVDDPSCQVVEFTLSTGDTVEAWVVAGGDARTVADLHLDGILHGGGLVFGSGGDGIQGSGFYFRPPGGPTTALDGHGGATPAPVISQTLGDQWIDTESGSIIYRIPGGQSDDQSAAPVAWYRHDIASDSVVAIEPAPQEPPAAKDGCSGGYVVGGWLVENCSGAHGTWLVDPTGAEPAMIYDGATPGWLGLEYGVDGASLGLEGGWGQLVRALPAP